jgi:hypothetical protein
VTVIGASFFFAFGYVAVKHGEPNKESDADEVFHAFDVRVIIYQRKYFFNLS